MDKKKQTKGDLERRMRNAIVLVPKDKEYMGIYFDDKGLRLEVTSDFAVITTGFHRHVFDNITSQGVSRPYLYTKRFIEIALENDCMVKDEKGNATRSYAKLFSLLDKKEDKSEFNVCWYYDLWLNNIFHPLFAIGETESESFLVYESFLHNVARNKAIMSEKVDDMTNLAFIDTVCNEEKKFVEGIGERVIFKKKTDNEKLEEEIAARHEQDVQKTLEENAE